MTDSQRSVLLYLQTFPEGYCPSYQEIKEHCGFASTCRVHTVIKNLEKRGHIERIPFLARAITVIKRIEA